MMILDTARLEEGKAVTALPVFQPAGPGEQRF
jgi:hypothetical protein